MRTLNLKKLPLNRNKLINDIKTLDIAKKNDITFCSLNDVLTESDIITIHLSLNNETRELIDKNYLNKVKKGSILINTSRGEIQDENAIYEALRSEQISGAGLDVFEQEPLPENSPLRKLKNVVLTPHSAPDRECYIRTVQNALENLIRVSKGTQPQSLAVDHEEVTRQFLVRFPEVHFSAS